ncbi:Gamma-aminobutyric acid receptor alpha-like [Exaiptasia diaphana]|nr:Gamma-aminobutyric acid receptor alpha-like [Exaiptasia diaphana]
MFTILDFRTNATRNEIAMISEHLTDILKTYDKRIRPDAEGPPIEIIAEFKVGSLGGISESEMSYSMDIFFRHWWSDPRLKSNFSKPITLSMDASSIIWIPDTYFVNSKYSSFHKVIGDCMRLIIWPNGTIYYSVRVDLELRCDMDLRLYPFDTQHCPFIVESHAYTKDDIIYKWNMQRTKGVEVSYLKAMDTFLMGSLFFIFMSLVEFVVVLNTSSSQTNKRDTTSTTETYGNLSTIDVQDSKVKSDRDNKNEGLNTISMNGSNDLLPSTPRCQDMPRIHGAHYVDTASRVLFPVLYLLFIGSLIAWYSS